MPNIPQPDNGRVLETNVMEMPTFQVAPVKHNHAAHLRYRSQSGGRHFALGCPDCDMEFEAKYGVPHTRGMLRRAPSRPKCPACLGENG